MRDLTSWGLVRRTALHRPEHPLILGDGAGPDLTYAELADRAGRLGRTLRRTPGYGPGEPVGVIASSPDIWVVLWAAIQAAGGVAVALDPTETDAVLRERLALCGVRTVLADPSAARRLAAWTQEALRVLGPEDAAEAPIEHDDRAVTDASAVFFTSGSTGECLGATLSHRGLLANCAAVCAVLGIGPRERTLSPLPLHHIYGFSVFLCHLAQGATLVPEGAFLYPQETIERMDRLACTGFSGVAFHYQAFLERTDLSKRTLASLRYWTQAGEPMPVELTRRLLQAHPQVRLYLMYGQTEASPRISVLDPSRTARKPGSVGTPLPGVKLRIRTQEGQEAAIGVEGEIMVGGDGVMLGYWKRPDRTAEVLEGGWLRTGDLGRVDAEGDLYLTGRNRRFLKVGGRRVVPEEIEAALLETPGVSECAVLGVPDGALGERPLAVIAGDPAPSADAALEICRRRLAPYKVPAGVVTVASLPRTATGKKDWVGIRRLALPRDRKEEVR